MRERFPNIALDIEAGYSITMMEQITENLLDIAVMYQPRILLDLEITKLYDDEFMLISTEPTDLENLDKNK